MQINICDPIFEVGHTVISSDRKTSVKLISNNNSYPDDGIKFIRAQDDHFHTLDWKIRGSYKQAIKLLKTTYLSHPNVELVFPYYIMQPKPLPAQEMHEDFMTPFVSECTRLISYILFEVYLIDKRLKPKTTP